MTDETFTDPEDDTDEWADVRMTNPDEGEWDVDLVVSGGRVGYVDLRIRPSLLAGFVGCLLDDVGDERASDVLATVAERRNLDLSDRA